MNELRLRARPKKVRWALAACVLLIALAAGFVFWPRPGSVLPDSLRQQVVYKPYFFEGMIPNGYTLDQSQSGFSEGVLMLTLTKPGGQVVLSQQELPDGLPKDFQQGGEPISGTAGPASISKVNDRFIATMVAPGQPKLLVLLTSATSDAAELSTLLKALKPAP